MTPFKGRIFRRLDEMALLHATRLAVIAEWIAEHGPIPARRVSWRGRGECGIAEYRIVLNRRKHVRACFVQHQVYSYRDLRAAESAARAYPDATAGVLIGSRGELHDHDVQNVLDWIRARERANEEGR